MVAEAAGGFSGERSPWKQAPVSVVLPQQQYRRQGKVGGSGWVGDLRGQGRMGGGGTRVRER